MLTKFGKETLDLENKSSEEQIELCSAERDRLDTEIKRFREIILHPTKLEHRYFVRLKDARKKLQMEVRRLRRFERRKADKDLHEQLEIMTKYELKQWRVLSHKLSNIEINLEQIQAKLHELNTFSKFVGLFERLKNETNQVEEKLKWYRVSMNEIQSIVTKHYYKDKEKADQERVQLSSTTERETSIEEEVTV